MVVKKYLTIFPNVGSTGDSPIINNTNADTLSLNVSGSFTSLSIEIYATATFESIDFTKVPAIKLSDNTSCEAITEAGVFEVPIASFAKILLSIISISGGSVNVTGKMVDGGNARIIADSGSSGGTTVVANPTLVGPESDLEGIQIGETKYKVPSGGGQQYDLVLTGENFNTNVVTLLTKIGEEVANYMGGIQPANFEYVVKVENVSGQQLDYLFTQPYGVVQADYIVVLGINPSSSTTDEYTGYYFYCNLQGRNIPSAPSNLSLTTSAFDAEIEVHPGGSVEHPDPYASTNFTDNAFYNGTMTLGFASYLYRTVE